jgi:hypothetical protein
MKKLLSSLAFNVNLGNYIEGVSAERATELADLHDVGLADSNVAKAATAISRMVEARATAAHRMMEEASAHRRAAASLAGCRRAMLATSFTTSADPRSFSQMASH